MQALLPRLNLPSRDEVTSVARRLTNIELRLDDLDGRIDDILQAVRTEHAAPIVAETQPSAPIDDARLQAIEARLDTLLAAIHSIIVAPAEAPKTPNRPVRRKPAAPAE
jgi:hypothetical protein